MTSLIVWMNGERVGEWGMLRGGRTPFFRYEESWLESPHGRALSLSLPITADQEVRGAAVDNYFDNLLPDNAEIRRRIRTRFGTASTEVFDLLTAIGRDCVGAVQLLPPAEEPAGWDRIDVTPLTENEVGDILRNVTVAHPLGPAEQEDFRISLAGAQEKTAFLHMAGRWFRPHRATPTTHILKLPFGVIGNFRGDFSDSVENEWLCAQLLRALELPVADVAMARFGEQAALVVTRFDRRSIGADATEVQHASFKPRKGAWIARLPQEDFCQAVGLPHTLRCQADGGPSSEDVIALLANSAQPQRPGGVYVLTPLYDVLSAWPIIGHGRNQLPLEKAKLAMAVAGRRPHYRLREITARHWRELAERTGVADLWTRMQSFVESAPGAIDRLGDCLPRGFPERVYTTVQEGVRAQAQRFAQTMSAS